MNKLKQLKFIIPIVILLIIGGFGLYKFLYNKAPKQIYEVAVMVRSQKSSNPEEDKKTSLKAGDVMMVKEVGRKWSRTESVSYLILKMNLTEEEARKIVSPVEKKLSKDEIKKELDQFIKEQDISKEEKKNFEEELERRRETVVMRKYRIDMEEFEGFKPIDLIKGQPYQEEVYDWGIVEKKK